MKSRKNSMRKRTEIKTLFSYVSSVSLFVVSALLFAGCVTVKSKTNDASDVKNQTSGASSRPDLVLIIIDSLRSDHMGCYGYARNTTPGIDAFAKEAAQFNQAVSSSSWTQPSVMSIFSSVEPATHLRADWDKPHNTNIITVAETLRNAGYQTIGITANGMTHRRFGYAQGFDLYDDFTAALSPEASPASNASQPPSGAILTRFATDWLLNKRDPSKPLFLFVMYMDPHWDYIPPTPYDTMFAENDPVPALRGISTLGNTQLTDIAKRRIINAYDGEIAFTDRHVSELLAAIKSSASGNRTAIAICSDHGEAFWERGTTVAHGNNLYDEEIRVPLIVKTPGNNTGRIIKQQVGTIDIGPTFLGFAGIPVPESWQGTDLAPLLRGDEMPEKPVTSDLRIFNNFITAVRTSEKKTIFLTAEPDKPIEIYDLKADPGETVNLSR